MSVSVPLSDGVFAVINASGAPVISSEGNLVDDMVDVTFEVYLTTQPNA